MSSRTSLELLEDTLEKEVDELAQLLGLRKVSASIRSSWVGSLSRRINYVFIKHVRSLFCGEKIFMAEFNY